MKQYREQLTRYFAKMQEAGFTWAEADTIRLNAERIDTWNTRECNGNIEWAEEGQLDHKGRKMRAGKPYTRWGLDNPDAPPTGYYAIIADHYTPARERIDAIAASRGYTIRHQGDPRGWPVYVVIDERNEIGAPIRDNKAY